MSRDLEGIAKNMLGDLIHNVETFDADTLRDEINDRAHEEADNAVIYHSTCRDIISDYETDPRASGADDDADGGGQEFKPSQYQEAMTAYAYYIALAIIQAEAVELLDGVVEAGEQLCSDIDGETEGKLDVSPEELRMSLQCPHGWASHDREDSDGTHYWVSKQLDGCNSVAIDAGPFWLSYTWTP